MTQDEFIEKLGWHESITIVQAMSKTGLSENTCRKHLNQLVKDGLYKKIWEKGDTNGYLPFRYSKYRYIKIIN